MSAPTHLELRFPDADTAIAVARSLSGRMELTALPPDGLLQNVRFDIAVVNGDGIVRESAAEGEPAPAPLPGYHVIGLWRGALETVPAALQPFMLPAGTLPVRFG